MEPMKKMTTATKKGIPKNHLAWFLVFLSFDPNRIIRPTREVKRQIRIITKANNLSPLYYTV
jgi:hypothetical protein